MSSVAFFTTKIAPKGATKRNSQHKYSRLLGSIDSSLWLIAFLNLGPTSQLTQFLSFKSLMNRGPSVLGSNNPNTRWPRFPDISGSSYHWTEFSRQWGQAPSIQDIKIPGFWVHWTENRLCSWMGFMVCSNSHFWIFSSIARLSRKYRVVRRKVLSNQVQITEMLKILSWYTTKLWSFIPKFLVLKYWLNSLK